MLNILYNIRDHVIVQR